MHHSTAKHSVPEALLDQRGNTSCQFCGSPVTADPKTAGWAHVENQPPEPRRGDPKLPSRKKIRVMAEFPELPAGHAFLDADASASKFPFAVKLALEKIFSSPHVKRRRITRFTLRVVRVDLGNGGAQ